MEGDKDFISPVNEVVVVDEEHPDWAFGTATYVMLGVSWLAMAWAEMNAHWGYTPTWHKRHDVDKRTHQLIRLQVNEEMGMARTVT